MAAARKASGELRLALVVMLGAMLAGGLVGWLAVPAGPLPAGLEESAIRSTLARRLRWPDDPGLAMLLGAVPLALWAVVDRLEKRHFRRGRPDPAPAPLVVHRVGPLSSALLPVASGVLAAAIASFLVPALLPPLGALGPPVIGLAVALLVLARHRPGLRLELAATALRLVGRRPVTIPWPAIGAARLVWRRSKSGTHFYLALAIDHPERFGLGRLSWLGRLVTSGERPGDVLLTPLDRFLAHPTRIVEDVQEFMARQAEQRSGPPQ